MNLTASLASSEMGISGVDNSVLLDTFLKSEQNRAYRIAQIATRNPEDALDLVQEAMFKLVEKYAQRPAEEWPPLFYRILTSRINLASAQRHQESAPKLAQPRRG